MVPVERTTRRETDDSTVIEIRTAVAPGDNVMHSGDDVAAGDRAVGPGTVLTTRDVGLLAALGVETVPVVEAPSVGIVSTGNELVRPGEPLETERGQISVVAAPDRLGKSGLQAFQSVLERELDSIADSTPGYDTGAE